MLRFTIRGILYFYCILLKFIGHRKKNINKNKKYNIMLTGNFYSDDWIVSHLKPLAMANSCKKIWFVAEKKLPDINKVVPIYPNSVLSTLLGNDVARLLTFSFAVLFKKVHIVGGFHLLLNGLFALFFSRIKGSYAMYICGGGPREVAGGGFNTENRIFGKLTEPDTKIERQLINIVSMFDINIVRGSSAAQYFSDKGVNKPLYLVPAGKDIDRFKQSDECKLYDLIIVARLTKIKRIEIYLEAIQLLKINLPQIKGIVVGDGPERNNLINYSKKLGIENNVIFCGHQESVEKYLKKSKIFVLTSESEGLSQAMIEAMLCGLPVIVPKVGDLSDLVIDSINGFLIKDIDAEKLSKKIEYLILSDELLYSFGIAALKSATNCSYFNVSLLWESILEGISNCPPDHTK
jgi:glycosyltransferase involved in cell wall biosynthesis